MTLLRLALVLGIATLGLGLLGLTALLGVVGYIAAHTGAKGIAAMLFTAAICPLALLAIMGSFIPDAWKAATP